MLQKQQQQQFIYNRDDHAVDYTDGHKNNNFDINKTDNNNSDNNNNNGNNNNNNDSEEEAAFRRMLNFLTHFHNLVLSRL